MSLGLSGVGLRRGIIGAGLLVLALLAGCSAFKLGYRQGPALAHWWLDGYLEFDNPQSQRVKEELRRWFDWHQATQLQPYANHLARARSEAQQAVTADQVCRWTDSTRELVVPAIERVLPAAAEVALTLTPAQLKSLDSRFAKKTAEMREEMLQPDPVERQRAALERTLKRFEGFYGTLTEVQKRLVEEGLKRSPFDVQLWFQLRERRHQEMMDSLRSIQRDKPAPAQVQERLNQMVRRFDGRSPMAGGQQAAVLSAYNCELTAQIHNSASPAQRRHLADKLRGWEVDLRALAAQPQAALAATVTP